MKQSKKIFTRMLINNWGGISHKILEFHEYVNLFSGKSGSGKSTVMDAIQVVLYGSVSANFLNKAADDTKNRRSVLSYLRGAQKDGTSNREDMDFCSQLVLEVTDTGRRTTTCIGACFEVGRSDTALNKYQFFSHSGKLSADEYLRADGSPYLQKDLKRLIEERKRSEENRGIGDVNRIYPSKEAYLNTLYDVIFGDLDGNRFATMEKSAIALRMTSGTGQFIKDYMFPRSKDDTVSAISEQLGAYREIKERVDDLEHRIGILDEIREHNLKLVQVRADQVKTDSVLRILDIWACKVRLEAKEQDLQKILQRIEELNLRRRELDQERKERTEELIRVSAELTASDYGKKQHEREELEHLTKLVKDNSRRWREVTYGLRIWEEEEEISGYVSNPTLQCIEELLDGDVSEQSVDKARKGLKTALELIDEELEDLGASIRETRRELQEKKEMVEDLKNDRKPYRKELKSARAALQSELSSQYGRTIHVEIFADLFDITDEKWKHAIEGRLGRIKHSLITAPEYALDAARIFRRMKRKEYEEVELINTAAIRRDEPRAEAGTLYEAVSAGESYVDLCLKRYLGRIRKCETVEELHSVRDGVTPDCYSYSNYIFRHLREADYTRYACIGTKVSKAKLKELEDEVFALEESLVADIQMRETLNRAHEFERLSQSTEELIRLSKAPEELQELYVRQERLERELKELADGTLTAQLQSRKEELEQRMEVLDTLLEHVSKEHIGRERDQGAVKRDLDGFRERLSLLEEGFSPNEELQTEVREALKNQPETAYRRSLNEKSQLLREQEKQAEEERAVSRNRFNREYPA